MEKVKSSSHMVEMYKVKYKEKSLPEVLELVKKKTEEINQLEDEIQALVEITNER